MSDDAIDAGFLRQEFGRLRAELEALAEKLGGNAHDAAGHFTDYLKNGGFTSRAASIEEGLERLGAGLKDKLKDGGKGAVTALEHEISSRPLASVAIAFGIGALAAQLLRRR